MKNTIKRMIAIIMAAFTTLSVAILPASAESTSLVYEKEYYIEVEKTPSELAAYNEKVESGEIVEVDDSMETYEYIYNYNDDSSVFRLAEGYAIVDSEMTTRKVEAIKEQEGEWFPGVFVDISNSVSLDKDPDELLVKGDQYMDGDNIYKIRILGDVNGDGKIKANDSRYILRVSSGEEVAENPYVYDINGDGKIMADDAMLLLHITLDS